ncbi:MAG: hypothetical protein ACYS7M_00620 [Planctomycetota bacterium]
MDLKALHSLAAVVLALLLPAEAARAEDAPAQVTLRGETWTVWPAADLLARGFDVQDLPRDRNAAWTYIEAVNAFAELPEDLTEAFEQALKHEWPKTSAGKALAAWITDKDNRQALELARKAAGMQRCQIPYFGDPEAGVLNVMLPSLSHYRHLAKMLVVEGRRLESEGRFTQALESYQTACRMGGHVAQGITLIESLVGVACWNVGDTPVREMVLRNELPPATLEKILAQTTELASHRPTVRRGMLMEKVFGLSIVDDFASRPSRALANLSGLGFEGTPRAKYGWRALEARIGRLILPDRTIKKHMAWFYDELLTRSELPGHEARWHDGWDQELLLSIPTWNVLARTILPALSRANELSERLRTSSQMTQVAIGLRLHTARHKGVPPEQLDELTQIFDDQDVLVDPFSGNRFVYRPEGKSWLLYSFGQNLVDDGGRESEKPWELDYVCRYPASQREEPEE